MCETTDLILKMAHEGKSKMTIREALGGVGRRSFEDILDAIGPVTFYSAPTYTVRGFHGTIKQIIAHFNLRISCHVVNKRMKLGFNHEECFFVAKYGKVMAVDGFTGSILEIIKHFKLTISADAVSRRLKRGEPVRNAFFDPVEVSRVRIADLDLKAKRKDELRAAYSQPLFG